MSIDIKAFSPREFNEFSKIAVFGEQAGYIPTIAELLNRFSGRIENELKYLC